MAVRLKTLDLSRLQTSTVRRRPYGMGTQQMASMPQPNQPLIDFFSHLPKLGQAAELVRAAELMAKTALSDKHMVWLIDGAFIRNGLSPLVLGLMQRGMINTLIMDGEAAVYDYELAFFGVSCERFEAGLHDGMLGLARETGEGINTIISEGVRRGFSIGESLGRGILDRQPQHMTGSLLATGAARLIPTTVHMTMGADGFQRYPGADGALLGKGSLKDSHILSGYLSNLPPGSLLVDASNQSSLANVFIHAYALARNLNDQLKGLNLIALNTPGAGPLDMLPDRDQMIHLPGAQEILLPLLMAALFSLVE